MHLSLQKSRLYARSSSIHPKHLEHTVKSTAYQFCLCLLFVAVTAYSQNEVLLHINRNGIQDILPLEKTKNIESQLNEYEQEDGAASHYGVVDTLRYFDSRNESLELGTNFGFSSQDVAFQWYYCPVEITIKELWWKNAVHQGTSKKARIRIWKVNKRLFDLPITAVNAKGRIGYYNTNCDSCETTITPFKPDSNAIFLKMQNSDTTNLFFDPLGEEWSYGDTTVTLDSNTWQKLSLPETPHLYLHEMEPFGFTIQNATLPSEGNDRMELYSKEIAGVDTTLLTSPYHSLKFYSTASSTDGTIGWQIRNYEFGMYVVASVTTDGPLLVFNFLEKQTPLKTNAENIIRVKINNFGWNAQPTEIKEAFLKYKIGYSPIYSTLLMSSSNDTFTVTIPPIPSGQKIFAYVVANDTWGNRMHSNIVTYSTVTDVKNSIERNYSFQLLQNYPNPFNPVTTIPYQIAKAGNVTLKVYDVLGREIAVVVNEYQSAGNYSKQWNASKTASGLYYYQLKSGEYTETKKLLLIK